MQQSLPAPRPGRQPLSVAEGRPSTARVLTAVGHLHNPHCSRRPWRAHGPGARAPAGGGRRRQRRSAQPTATAQFWGAVGDAAAGHACPARQPPALGTPTPCLIPAGAGPPCTVMCIPIAGITDLSQDARVGSTGSSRGQRSSFQLLLAEELQSQKCCGACGPPHAQMSLGGCHHAYTDADTETASRSLLTTLGSILTPAQPVCPISPTPGGNQEPSALVHHCPQS